jgi:hypothetical protein
MNGEPYTLKDVRTVLRRVVGNLSWQHDKALAA